MSPNDWSRPSASHRASSRIPGVSRTRPPSGRRWSCRRVVVCRPCPSSSRISRVAATSAPASRFSSVDLPTPDEPTKATVRPGPIRALTSSTPRPSTELTTMTAAPAATRVTSARAAPTSTSVWRSALVSSTTGSAPLSQAIATYRSRRRRLSSAFSDATTKTMSRLAPTTCASVRRPGACRTSAVRRGSRAWMTVSPTMPPSTATQSPTAGNAAGSSSAWNRKRPLTAARCSPASPTSRYEPRSSATTRAGSRPSAACSACAFSIAVVQPRWARPPVDVVIEWPPHRRRLPDRDSSDSLQLSGPLGVALGATERPQPERDEDGTHHDERPDITEERRHRRAVDQALPHTVQDVRRRRQVRQDLHPAGQDVDRVVDPTDEQQARLEDERHLRAALDVQQREDRRDHPDPDETERAKQHEGDDRQRIRAGEVELGEEQDQHDEDHRRVDQPVQHRVQDRPEQLRPAPDRRHHRVLERSFPALDADRLGDPAEHYRQVVPEDRPDHQQEQQAGAALVGADQRDAECARHGIDQEGDLPAPVASCQEEVPLHEGVRRLQLVSERGHRSSPSGCAGPTAHRDRASL